MDSVGEGEGGKIWENGIETCIISYMKQVASPGSMHDTGCLGLVHWNNPEGWWGGRREEGSGWGTHVYLWRIHFDIWQNQYNIVKLKKKLHSICQQIWKIQQWQQDWKRSVLIPIPKKGNAKECSYYLKTALISYASQVIVKTLQARLQWYMNQELPDVQARFRKGRWTRYQILGP